jgi:hypothetical protein
MAAKKGWRYSKRLFLPPRHKSIELFRLALPCELILDNNANRQHRAGYAGYRIKFPV